jgi:aminoglycoside phosphotransferase (APT) family kinase protein
MAGGHEDAEVVAARDAIEARIGRTPLRMDTIVRYEGRLVCLVTLPDARLVFKAGPGESVRLEAWTSATLRPLGVLVPAIVAVDTSRTRFPLDYLLMEEVPGGPLAGWPSDRELSDLDLDRQDVRDLLREAGRQLRLVHSVTMPGFGPLDAMPLSEGRAPAGRRTSWRDHVAGDVHGNLGSLVRGGVIAPADAAAARAVLDPCIDRLELRVGALLHGDFIARHLFVTPAFTRLTGILDFQALSGDPAFDVAVADVDHRRLEPGLGRFARHVLEGYQPDPAMLRDVSDRLLLYRAVRAAGEAAFMHANGEDVRTQIGMLRWNLEHLAAAS